jgi:hypothetical protein
MKHSAKESRIQSAILNFLNKIEGCKAINFPGTPNGKKGTPDIIGCYRGFMFVIEVKRPGEEPEKIQLFELNDWLENGATSWIFHSVHECSGNLYAFTRMIDEILRTGKMPSQAKIAQAHNLGRFFSSFLSFPDSPKDSA